MKVGDLKNSVILTLEKMEEEGMPEREIFTQKMFIVFEKVLEKCEGNRSVATGILSDAIAEHIGGLEGMQLSAMTKEYLNSMRR